MFNVLNHLTFEYQADLALILFPPPPFPQIIILVSSCPPAGFCVLEKLFVTLVALKVYLSEPKGPSRNPKKS